MSKGILTRTACGIELADGAASLRRRARSKARDFDQRLLVGAATKQSALNNMSKRTYILRPSELARSVLADDAPGFRDVLQQHFANLFLNIARLVTLLDAVFVAVLGESTLDLDAQVPHECTGRASMQVSERSMHHGYALTSTRESTNEKED